MGKNINVLSYGGGRQTAGVLALVALRRLPKPDMALFADTGGELPETYEHIEKYMKPLAERLGIEFHTTQYTIRKEPVSLYDYSYKYRWIPQPWQRMCTRKFKIEAIRRYLKPYYKSAGVPIRCWVGISREESRRVRPSGVPWMDNWYPLVEHRLSMNDCVAALNQLGIPEPPKSACYYCPFQTLTRWKELRRKHPELFEKAIALENRAREKSPGVTLTGKAPLTAYLEGEQGAWEELLDAESGCSTGYCFV